MPPSQLTVPDNLILTSNSTNLLALKGTATPPAAVIYAPSTAAQSMVLNDQPFSSLIKIQGDTRTAAGQSFATTGSITKSGNNCTITLTSTPPSDFTSSDYVMIGGATSAANVGRFPIVSIDTANKTVTYTNSSRNAPP